VHFVQFGQRHVEDLVGHERRQDLDLALDLGQLDLAFDVGLAQEIYAVGVPSYSHFSIA
jgi:hypothetical protein